MPGTCRLIDHEDAMPLTIDQIANYHCACGENPLWDDQRSLLYWEDIPNGRLFVFDPATGEHRMIHEGPEQTGGFTFQQGGELLLFRETDIALRRDDGRIDSILPFDQPDIPRFNDVIADPQGRVFAGTMGKQVTHGVGTGGLFRIDPDRTITRLWLGTTCSNGMAFSPDGQTFYWTDSPARTIWAFDYERATGDLTRRRVHVDSTDLPGVPDGMAIDTEGNLWSARWDGYGIYIYDPAGRCMNKIDMPVAKVSSCCWGGADLDELYVTTAGGEAGSLAADGALYRITGTGARGAVESRSRIEV
jgi:sugar lactone lactonase YvrE